MEPCTVREYTQWGVGQGSFGTATFFHSKHSPRPIHVVFDCGGSSVEKKSSLRRSIDSFARRDRILTSNIQLDTPPVEAFFLSHYDLDHYNGIEYLSHSLTPRGPQNRSKGKKIFKYAFYPDTPLLPRMLSLLRSVQPSSLNLENLNKYLRMSLDPDEYLREYAEHVIKVSSADPDADPEAPSTREPQTEGGSPGDLKVNWHLGNLTAGAPSSLKVSNTQAMKVASLVINGDTKEIWHFTIWKPCFVGTGYTEGTKEMLSEIAAGISTTSSDHDVGMAIHKKINEAIQSRSREEVEETIRYIQKALGLAKKKKDSKTSAKAKRNKDLKTSAKAKRNKDLKTSAKADSNRYGLCVLEGNSAWAHMHVGDMDLKDRDLLDGFGSAFSSKLPDIGFFELPHHGSKHNWDNDLTSFFHFTIWLGSSDRTGRYHHPSKEVLYDISSSSKGVFYLSDKITSFHFINCLSDIRPWAHALGCCARFCYNCSKCFCRQRLCHERQCLCHEIELRLGGNVLASRWDGLGPECGTCWRQLWEYPML